MKKICVFGADGRTGVELVKELHARKYSIVACMYNEKSRACLPQGTGDIAVEIVNVLNIEDVERAVRNCDAVISVIGHIRNSDPFMQTKGIQNIIASMKQHEIRRIVSLTGTGVREVGDTPSLFDRLGNLIIKLIDKERIIDGIEHAKALRQSGLDWTIVRVLKLGSSDTSSTDYTLSAHGPAEPRTSRKKVARILADQVTSDEWIGKSPISS